MPSTQHLVSWALSHGATLHQNLQVHEDESGYSLRTRIETNGIVEKENSDTNRTIVSCPLVLSLSAFNAFYQYPLSHLTESDPACFPHVFLDKTPFHVTGKFFLCQQYLLLESSFWFPYISALPQPVSKNHEGKGVDTPLYWTEDELEWIKGTNMEFARQERLDSWEMEWRDGFQILRGEEFRDWESYTWDLYKWAATIFSSRCFGGASSLPLHLLHEENAGEDWLERVQEEHKSSQVLFPLVDLANHDPTAKVTWRVGSNDSGPQSVESFKIIAENDIPSGREVFNNYGSIKYNSELLLGYGFCLPDIRNDYVAVDFKIQDWLKSALNMWKERSCYDAKPFEDTKLRYSFGWNTRSSERKQNAPEEFLMLEHGLLDILAIGMANDVEIAHISKNHEICLEDARPDGPLARLLFSAIFVIEEKLKYDREKIMRCLVDREPKSRTENHAKIYRDGQLLILNQTIIALEERLMRAFGNTQSWVAAGEMKCDLPSVTLWTIRDAYDLLSQWGDAQDFSKVPIHGIIQKTRQTLELEPHETLHSPEVLQEGYDSMLWILWLSIGSSIVSQTPHELIKEKSPILQWIAEMETKHPILSKPPRRFSGEKQDFEMLKEILSSTQMTDSDIRDRISWASHIVMENSIDAPRIWERGMGGEMVESGIKQRVLCVSMGYEGKGVL